MKAAMLRDAVETIAWAMFWVSTLLVVPVITLGLLTWALFG